jgi:hypothetical protein
MSSTTPSPEVGVAFSFYGRLGLVLVLVLVPQDEIL